MKPIKIRRQHAHRARRQFRFDFWWWFERTVRRIGNAPAETLLWIFLACLLVYALATGGRF